MPAGGDPERPGTPPSASLASLPICNSSTQPGAETSRALRLQEPARRATRASRRPRSHLRPACRWSGRRPPPPTDMLKRRSSCSPDGKIVAVRRPAQGAGRQLRSEPVQRLPSRPLACERPPDRRDQSQATTRPTLAGEAAVQPDGKIVAAGCVPPASSSASPATRRRPQPRPHLRHRRRDRPHRTSPPGDIANAGAPPARREDRRRRGARPERLLPSPLHKRRDPRQFLWYRRQGAATRSPTRPLALAVQEDGKVVAAGRVRLAPLLSRPLRRRMPPRLTRRRRISPSRSARSPRTRPPEPPSGASRRPIPTVVTASATAWLRRRGADNGSFAIAGGELRVRELRLRDEGELHDPGALDRRRRALLREAAHDQRHQRERGAGRRVTTPTAPTGHESGRTVSDRGAGERQRPGCGDYARRGPRSGTTHGALTLASDGSFLYAPAAGFAGSDGFSYRAGDGSLTSDLVTVTIVVSPPTGIAVTPANPTIANGTSQQFTATGTYADGATADLTAGSPGRQPRRPSPRSARAGSPMPSHRARARSSATLGLVQRRIPCSRSRLTAADDHVRPRSRARRTATRTSRSAPQRARVWRQLRGERHCTVSGTTVHITGAGSCTITASQPATRTTRRRASRAGRSRLGRRARRYVRADSRNKRLGDPDFTVAASASSGLAVAFSARGPARSPERGASHRRRQLHDHGVAGRNANYNAAARQSGGRSHRAQSPAAARCRG